MLCPPQLLGADTADVVERGKNRAERVERGPVFRVIESLLVTFGEAETMFDVLAHQVTPVPSGFGSGRFQQAHDFGVRVLASTHQLTARRRVVPRTKSTSSVISVSET
jgi:hypothetical protein